MLTGPKETLTGDETVGREKGGSEVTKGNWELPCRLACEVRLAVGDKAGSNDFGIWRMLCRLLDTLNKDDGMVGRGKGGIEVTKGNCELPCRLVGEVRLAVGEK